MKVTEFDPAHADDAELSQWRRVLNAMTEADMSTEPRWHEKKLREYLAVTMPGQERIAYVAREEDQIVGHATLLVGEDFAEIGIFEIFVHPAHRGAGVGRALLGAIASGAISKERELIGVEVIASTPAVEFYERLGFTRALVENRHLLAFSEIDWDHVTSMSERVAAGYRLEYFSEGLPDELMERYASTKSTMKAELGADAQPGRADEDVQRLRDSLNTLADRGMRTHLVVAINESNGAVAGLTELVVAAQRPTRGDQYDTVVAANHRSYGLELAMKARMLCELREAESQLVDVQTWTAIEDDPHAHVDKALGFRNDVQWYEYEAPAFSVVERLGLQRS